jgi:hypothetical protein
VPPARRRHTIRHMPWGGLCRSHQRPYGLTCEEFDALWLHSGGVCAICGVTGPDTPHGMLHIDHDYKFGYRRGVRGLLCSRCNTLLGRGLIPQAGAERYEANMWTRKSLMSGRIGSP